MKKIFWFLNATLLFSACQKDMDVDKIPKPFFAEMPAPPPPQGQSAKALVVKYEGIPYFTLVPVPDRDKTMVINVDMVETCNGNFTTPTVMDLQSVVKQEEGLPRVHDLFHGDHVYFEIWDFASSLEGVDCQLFLDEDKLFYSGFVKIRGTDNDVFPYDDHDPNRNTFGFVASNDEISVVVRGGWDGYHNDTWKVQVCKIRFK